MADDTERPEEGRGSDDRRSGRSGAPRDRSGGPGGSRAGGPREGRPFRRDGAPRRDGSSSDRDGGDRRGFGRSQRDGDRKPYSRDGGGDRKPYSRDGGGDRKPYRRDGDRDRKPYSRDGGDRKPYARDGGADRKPYSRDGGGDRKPYSRDGDRDRKPYSRDGGSRDGKPFRRDGDAPRGARPQRDGGRPQRDGGYGGRPERSGGPQHARRGGADRPSSFGRGGPRSGGAGDESTAPRHNDPVLPDDVAPGDLDRQARAQLKSLSKENAERVAKHLAMAARLIDEDPALAHQHALAASRTAGRIPVVRESVGITAYATGDFALALRELRTYRRISGRDDQLPLMVDSERGVGRPERALELGRSVDRASLEPEVRAALSIAMSGARLDLGQTESALAELRLDQVDRDRAFPWSPDLFRAIAAVLEDLGRAEESQEWSDRADRAESALDAAAVDPDLETIEVIATSEDDEDDDDDGAPEGDAETSSNEPVDGPASSETEQRSDD